ncbi:MAG: DUF1080 domain-containing protein [Acidobacteria bacterium]|nr:DUF1080 domain-containing protein [Acidobacteriota bacterium]
MKYTFVATLAVLLLVGPGTAAQGPVSLLDGTSLNGWTISGDANWRPGDGGVEADGGRGHLVTDGSYRDFVLTTEFWVDEPANSGVFIRCEDRDAVGPNSCYEVNIFDQRPDPSYRTGAITNFASAAVEIVAAGKWNTLEIRAEGARLVVALNGTVTADIEDSTHAEGPITLQYFAGVVKFRNLQIQTL